MEARHSARGAGEAEDAVKELRAELAKAGMILPSPGLDPVGLARKAPCPLVVPGRTPSRGARRLVAVPR